MKSLFVFLQNVRFFLEPIWQQTHKEWGEIPLISSSHMCLYTSLFLKTVLKINNYGTWTILLGRPSIEKNGTYEGVYGYESTNKTWHDHAWLIKQDMIIDITADQFGGNNIYLGPSNVGYKANLSEAEISFILKRLSKRVDSWLYYWNSQ